MKKNYTNIIFDIDGTLIDTEEGVIKSWQEVVRALTGREMTAAELQFTIGFPNAESFQILGIADCENVEPIYYESMERHLRESGPFPGIRELLYKLKSDGYKVGVITSRTRQEYRQGFDNNPLDKLFDCRICSNDTARRKPFPDPMLKYLELTGTAPGDALYIGDTAYDAECATSAGVDFALALWGRHDNGESIPSTHYLKTPEALLSIL